MADRGNPYQSPDVVAGPPVMPTDGESMRQEKHRMLGELVVRWEKLRLLYNTILAGLVLLFAALSWRTIDLSFFEEAVGAGLAANVCFLAGPAVDGYISWFLFRHKAVTWFIFLAGTAASVLLAIGFVLFRNFPGPT